jgi:hypothetical protein
VLSFLPRDDTVDSTRGRGHDEHFKHYFAAPDILLPVALGVCSNDHNGTMWCMADSDIADCDRGFAV